MSENSKFKGVIAAMELFEAVRSPGEYQAAIKATERLVPNAFDQLCMVDCILEARYRAYPETVRPKLTVRKGVLL